MSIYSCNSNLPPWVKKKIRLLSKHYAALTYGSTVCTLLLIYCDTVPIQSKSIHAVRPTTGMVDKE
jgi:hypothetical protein